MHGPGFISSDMREEPAPLSRLDGGRTSDVPRGLAMLIAQRCPQTKKVRGSRVRGCNLVALADGMVVAAEILERLNDAVARAGNDVREDVTGVGGGWGYFRRAFSDHVSFHFARAS